VHGFHVALSDNRCDYRRLLKLHRGWSHNERHALERVLNALKKSRHHGVAILELLQERHCNKKKEWSNVLQSLCK
jgi:hypothetical protein